MAILEHKAKTHLFNHDVLEDIYKKAPCIVFEEIYEWWNQFKGCSTTPYQGGLWSHHVKEVLKAVHIIYPNVKQIYVVHNLHKVCTMTHSICLSYISALSHLAMFLSDPTLHYCMLQCRPVYLELSEFGPKTTSILCPKSYTDNGFLKVWNHSMDEYYNFCKQVDNLKLATVIGRAYDSTKLHPDDRGNFQINAGFSGQNQKDSDGMDAKAPQPNMVTSDWKESFVNLSLLAKKLGLIKEFKKYPGWKQWQELLAGTIDGKIYLRVSLEVHMKT